LPFQGTAPNKTFTRTDGYRTGSEVWQEAENLGLGILSKDQDTHDQDIANAINGAWQKNGDNQPTANLPMGGYKLTGHGAASARSQLPLTSQVQDGAFNFGITTGTANAYAVSVVPAITAYADGMPIAFKTSVASSGTGQTTLNVNGLGAKRIVKNGSLDLVANDFQANVIYEVRYNSQTDTFNIVLDTTPPVSSNTVSGTISIATRAEAKARTDNTKALTPATVNEMVLRSGDSLSGGFTATAVADGTKSSGTYTPDPTTGNMRTIVNGGNFTLAKPTVAGDYTMIVQVTNNASAGTITFSGFSKVDGYPITTTSGDDFLFFITKIGTFCKLTVDAMQ
jgi:hypothetical protein